MPWQNSCRLGHLDVVVELLKCDKVHGKETALLEAVSCGRSNVVRIFVQFGKVDVDAMHESDRTGGGTYLMLASVHGQFGRGSRITQERQGQCECRDRTRHY